MGKKLLTNGRLSQKLLTNGRLSQPVQFNRLYWQEIHSGNIAKALDIFLQGVNKRTNDGIDQFNNIS